MFEFLLAICNFQGRRTDLFLDFVRLAGHDRSFLLTHSVRQQASAVTRAMLDRLPTELLLVIAELAAPLAYSRYRLVVDRRSWFASLASICRSLWHRLRPLIYTEIWIFDEDEVRALASGIEHDPSFAPFTKRLVCFLDADTLEELGRVFPRFRNVTSVDIMGGGTDVAPLQLSVIERLRSELVLIHPVSSACRPRRQ